MSGGCNVKRFIVGLLCGVLGLSLAGCNSPKEVAFREIVPLSEVDCSMYLLDTSSHLLMVL